MDQQELYGNWWPPQKAGVLLFKANPIRFDYFKHFIGNWKNKKALDVGCGGGYICEYLAGLDAIVHGTDIMQRSLDEAQNHAIQNNLRIEYSLCTEEKLPFNDNDIDLVTCFDVLEHVSDKQITLKEIYRVLNPGGWFFFDTPNKTFLSKLLAIWLVEDVFRAIPKGGHDWNNFINPDDLRRLLEKTGFKNIDFAGIKLNLGQWSKLGLPAKISPTGHKGFMYFGAAMKPIE